MTASTHVAQAPTQPVDAVARPTAATLEFDLFRGLPASHRRALAASLNVCSCAAGSVIYQQGDASDRVYFVLEGVVRTGRLTLGGKQLTTSLVDKGESFGDDALVDSGPRRETAWAHDDTVVAWMDADTAAHLARCSPVVSTNLSRILLDRGRAATGLAEHLAYATMSQRVALLLVELDRRYGHPTLAGNRVINRHFRRDEIAAFAGTSREVVTRQLSAWRQAGLVANRGNRIELLDVEALRRAAGPDALEASAVAA